MISDHTGWKLASDCALQLVGAASRSSEAVLQQTLRSASDESRQYSTALILVDALSLRALPFAGASGDTLTLNLDTHHNFTAHVSNAASSTAAGGFGYDKYLPATWICDNNHFIESIDSCAASVCE